MPDKPDPQEELIPLQKLKQLIPLAEREPMSCAFGLTKDRSALLLVDKLLSPKKVRDRLKKDAKASLELTSLRFGQIVIDKANDPDTVRFTVNKPEVGGTVMALVRLVKKTGYQGIVINPDAALEKEPEAGEEAPTTARPGGATPTEAQQQTPAPEPSSPPPPPPPPPTREADAPLDANALAAQLMQLAQQIPLVSGGNPMLQQPLVKLAGAAQAKLKAADLQGAAAGIDELRRAIAAAAEQAKLAQQAKDGGGAVTYAKSRLAWLAARKKVESEIDKLRAALVATYEAEGIAPDLERAYAARVAPVLAALDERLADKLDEASNAADPNARAKLVGEAKEIMGDYATFLNTDKTIAQLDANPFVPLSIAQTISATLSTLAKAVH